MSKRFPGAFRWLVAFLIATAVVRSYPAEPTTQQIEFFETKIRPLFAEHCYSCHSDKAEKVKGGLRLDSPEAVLKGGSSGPIIIAGNPDGSPLIKAVRYTDPDLQMPPKNKKLPDEKIANLEAWVKMGAPSPHIVATMRRPLTDVTEARARHWAFQAVTKPVPPPVKLSRWVETPVDNFVLAALEKKHLTPAPAADRRTLIRRVTYDLIGLPPTSEEVEAFVQDQRPDAYARVVERLLASPHYGERWGRYWLDVARFADTKGYLAGGEERRYAFSYTYRDYVVRAFNEDKPYDQFLIEQIAADLVLKASTSSPATKSGEQLAGKDAGAPGEDRRSLAALGFLTLGRRFLNNPDDIIDDRMDVVTRGTLGLTLTCARCHDHKFDPIPTKDYYALHGVFASTEEPSERPLLGPLHDSPEYQDYLKQKAKIQNEIVEFTAKEVAKLIAELRHHVGDYLLGARDAARLSNQLSDQSKFDLFAGEHKLDPTVLRRWMKELETRGKKPDPIFQPWFDLVALPEEGFATDARPLLAKLSAEPGRANPDVVKSLVEGTTNSLKEVAESYSKLFRRIDTEWKAVLEAAAKASNALPVSLPDPRSEALRQVLYADGAAVNLPKDVAESLLARLLADKTAPIRNRIEELNWTQPGVPPRAMAVQDRASPINSHVHIRGSAGNPGEEVPRRFIEVLSGPSRAPFTNGSGRLELARAIASPENPMTARVFVNRVWRHHFGEGIVTTPGDFGVRTEEPVHRALLDYLAVSFVQGGWSTKSLHRLILLSATYQQSSDAQPATLRADPDNRLLSRMNRQRLDFEAMRDTLLAFAGKLDLRLGGIPVDIESQPFATRRTIYGLIDRQNLPALFRTFDFANPDTSNQGRFSTTVPQQALFLMNSPFVIEQALSLAKRVRSQSSESCAAEIQALYRIVLQRPADRAELALAENFMASQPSHRGDAGHLTPLEEYAQILLLSNEVMFVD